MCAFICWKQGATSAGAAAAPSATSFLPSLQYSVCGPELACSHYYASAWKVVLPTSFLCVLLHTILQFFCLGPIKISQNWHVKICAGTVWSFNKIWCVLSLSVLSNENLICCSCVVQFTKFVHFAQSVLPPSLPTSPSPHLLCHFPFPPVLSPMLQAEGRGILLFLKSVYLRNFGKAKYF